MARIPLDALLRGVTTFGDWTVLREGVGIPRPGNGMIRTVLCRCKCGTERELTANSLNMGRTLSCGCRVPALITSMKTVHGGVGTPEYRSWAHMKERCRNPKCKDYPDYGGRGIRVCDAWATDFAAFLADLGPRPTPRHSLDRIDVDGNYEPGNVRWASPITQAGNKRTTRYVDVDGEPMALKAACRHLGVSYKLVHARMSKGQSFSEAVVVP